MRGEEGLRGEGSAIGRFAVGRVRCAARTAAWVVAARAARTAVLAALVACALFVGLFPMTAFAASDGKSSTADPRQPSGSPSAYDISISDLSTADESYDNRAVQVTGEAVGDRIAADGSGRYWILLTSTDTKSNDSVMVYMADYDADKIDAFGRYNIKGTTLRVKGTFHLVCPEHEGQSDLHADQVSVVAKGEQATEAFEGSLFVPGAVTVAVGGMFLVVYYRIRERRR